jgi:hypothetical protein
MEELFKAGVRIRNNKIEAKDKKSKEPKEIE